MNNLQRALHSSFLVNSLPLRDRLDRRGTVSVSVLLAIPPILSFAYRADRGGLTKCLGVLGFLGDMAAACGARMFRACRVLGVMVL